MEQAPIAAGPLEASVRRDDMQFCCGDDGRAYYVKAHIPLDEFMAAVRYEVDADDPILKEEPAHCWMRVCRDFEQECSVLTEAAPGSRGGRSVRRGSKMPNAKVSGGQQDAYQVSYHEEI